MAKGNFCSLIHSFSCSFAFMHWRRREEEWERFKVMRAKAMRERRAREITLTPHSVCFHSVLRHFNSKWHLLHAILPSHSLLNNCISFASRSALTLRKKWKRHSHRIRIWKFGNNLRTETILIIVIMDLQLVMLLNFMRTSLPNTTTHKPEWDHGAVYCISSRQKKTQRRWNQLIFATHLGWISHAN